ncbi:MAG TPA: hypothetical protein VLZ03_11730 [Thermodesulfobacteriota bacterium]|nr:hypothetical protein [Thermodesulfobacteriota bacterium]
MMLTYGRFHFDDQGIKKGSRDDYLVRWDDVTSVLTFVMGSRNGKYYRTDISTRTEQSISLSCRKAFFTFSKLPGYGKVLEFIAKKAPEPFVSEKTKYVAKWGQQIGSMKKLQMTTGSQILDVEDLKFRGNLHLVQFHFWKAKKAFRKILAMNPNDGDALEGIALADIDSGESLSQIIPQLEHLVALSPYHVGYLRRLTMLMLDTDDSQGENYASRLINLNPGEISGRLSLAFYNFRKGLFSESETILRATETAANDSRVKGYVREQISYIEKYETDSEFRKEENVKATKRTPWTILKYIVVALIILFFLFRMAQRIFKF